MPRIPNTAKLTANSVDILNAVRNSASSTYQERIPVATQENIREIGNAMMSYQSTQNEFLSALVNRIGRVLITSKMYENPLRMFKKGMLEFGETVEEIFVQVAKAHQFDPNTAEKEVFKREIPDVLAAFHRMNTQNFYKATISNDQLRQAFLSYDGITDLIARIVDQMYTGANFDEFLIMKQLIVDGVNDGKFNIVTIPEPTAENAKSIVSTIKGISNKLEFMSSDYNYLGVLTHTRKEDQILIIDAAFDAIIDVEVLASAFNMSKAEFMGQRVLIDNFGTLTGAYAALVDREWFMVFDNFINFTEQYNGEGLYWNYWYHVWKTYSTSPFCNAILFTTQTQAITSVTISPKTVTLAKGANQQFTAAVVGTGYVDKSVVWTVSGNSDTKTTINNSGLLHVGEDETNGLTVTVTSVVDGEKSDTATVTLS